MSTTFKDVVCQLLQVKTRNSDIHKAQNFYMFLCKMMVDTELVESEAVR